MNFKWLFEKPASSKNKKALFTTLSDRRSRPLNLSTAAATLNQIIAASPLPDAETAGHARSNASPARYISPL